MTMAHRQMVRQRTLTPSFQGSNPCGPAFNSLKEILNNIVIEDFYLQFFIFVLTKQLRKIIIMIGLSGETGVNPVRARRRKA